jgi:hypothetical protein
MNYAAHYERLIRRARVRTLDGYRERHHVIPKCIGGPDVKENIVALTPEEHYVAHQLLVKMHPGQDGLATGVVHMAKRCSGNKAFGWLRRRAAWSKIGKQRSPETRAKISAAKKGIRLGPQSPEHIAKVSATKIGRPRSAETKAKLANASRGNTNRRGAILSAETRAKIGAANLCRIVVNRGCDGRFQK